jgi:rod shape-determining protein MreC
MSRRIVIPSVAVFLALTAVILLLSPHNLRRVQATFLGMISPFLKTGSSLEKKYRGFREGLKSIEQLEEEVKQLRISNKEMMATNQTLSDLKVDNDHLRKLLGFKNEHAALKLLSARVVSRDSSTWYNQIVIDRGEKDHVTDDMAVLTEDGLVGKTTVVSSHSAIVVLITDETCGVAAKVEDSLEQGIVRGERTHGGGGMPTIGFKFLSKQANLKPGQNVLTSGLGGVFPKGVAVGKVLDFKVGTLDSSATIIPAVDLTTLEDVFVVVEHSK